MKQAQKHFTLALLALFFAADAFAQPSITDATKLTFTEGNNSWRATALDFKTYLSLSGGGTVTSFSSGNLSPLFTTSVSNASTTPALSFTLSNAAANTYFGNGTGSSAAPSFTAAGSITKVDDTNVTLTLGGTPTSSLLKSVSFTLGWTGQLGISRGGTGLSAVGSDVTLLGSNGTANVYLTPAITTTAAAIGFSRSSTTLNLNLPDADASNRGTVSTGTQTFAGAKTFSGAATVQGLLTGSAGVVGTATASQAAFNAAGVSDADYTVITANTTLDNTNNVVVVGTLTADITISLPDCNSTRDGWEYAFLKTGTDAFAFILDPSSTQTFYDGASTKSFYSVGNTARCKCRSSNNTWFLLQ